MKSRQIKSRLLCISFALVTLLVTPNFFYDPITTPKLTFLFISSSGFLLIFIRKVKLEMKEHFDIPFVKILILFSIISIINLIVNHNSITERIYGVRSIGNGFLTFLALAVVSFLSLQYLNAKFFLLSLNICGGLVACYFIIQLFGFDLLDFQTFYSVPSSTLGNPNFVSGFLGFSTLSNLFFLTLKRNRFGLLIVFSLSLQVFVLLKAGSAQGIIGLASGLIAFAILNLLSSSNSKPLKNSLLISGIGLIFIIFVAFNWEFIESRVLGSSAYSRFDYWRAGLRMIGHRPFIGFGFDSFGDNYFKFRDVAALNRFGAGQTTESPHNVFLEMFTIGGIPLGMTFLLISLYPAVKLVRNLEFRNKHQKGNLCLLSIWLSYQVQLFVSVSNVGTAIWGWALAGLMASVAKSRSSGESRPINKFKTRSIQGLLTMVVVTMITATIPLAASEHKFLVQARKNDGLGLSQTVMSWPQDSRRIQIVIQGWMNSKNYSKARELIKFGIEFNPNHYAFWNLYGTLPDLSLEEQNLVDLQRKRFDLNR